MHLVYLLYLPNMHYKLLSCTKIENLKIYSRSEIMQANVISKAEVMDGKMRLDFAVEMGFKKNKVLHCL